MFWAYGSPFQFLAASLPIISRSKIRPIPTHPILQIYTRRPQFNIRPLPLSCPLFLSLVEELCPKNSTKFSPQRKKLRREEEQNGIPHSRIIFLSSLLHSRIKQDVQSSG